MSWREYLEILTAIIIIVDPLGAIPIFISLTGNQSEHERSHTARVAVLFAALVLIGAIFAGKPMLDFFGIRIASFRVAGGILVFMTALSMMNAKISGSKQSPEEAKEAEHKENVAVVPLAVPLLAGPAAISTVIIYAHAGAGWGFRGFLGLCVLLVALVVWLCLRLSIPLSSKLGRTGLNNLTRLMGLLLAAIAVEFVATGAQELFQRTP
ncbi:MAG: MarC family protein [Candidatus Zixiibacteriota bacterium]